LVDVFLFLGFHISFLFLRGLRAYAYEYAMVDIPTIQVSAKNYSNQVPGFVESQGSVLAMGAHKDFTAQVYT